MRRMSPPDGILHAIMAASQPSGGRIRRISSNRFGLFIRTIGIARAEAKRALANIAYNFDRLIFHERRRAMG